MQIDQRFRSYLGNAKLHLGAESWIQHPSGHHDDHASRNFYVDDLTSSAPLRVLAPNAAPIKCVPFVVNFYFLPDMGRMTLQ
jgi:hypothetical protein